MERWKMRERQREGLFLLPFACFLPRGIRVRLSAHEWVRLPPPSHSVEHRNETLGKGRKR
jgi:hypothetical protein